MKQISAFRGASGEVVRGFIRPGTLGTCIPVMICTIVLGAIASAIVGWGDLPNWASLPISTVFTAPLVGLFAVAARQGKLNSGFFEALVQDRGRVFGFVMRFSALAAPCGALAGFSIEKAASSFGAMAMQGPAAMTGGLVWLGLFLVGGVLGPSLSLLVATRTDSVGEALSPQAWGWLADRRGDLPAFFASAIGGLMLFWMLSMPLIAVMSAIGGAMDPRLGLMIAALAWVAPFAASPILLGRLAGAFACGDFMDEADLGLQPSRPTGAAPRPRAPAPAPNPAPSPAPSAAAPSVPAPPGPAAAPSAPGAALAGVASSAAASSTGPTVRAPEVGSQTLAGVSAPGTSLERKTPAALLVRQIEEKAETDLGGALRDCAAALDENDRSAPLMLLHARLAKRAGLEDEALQAASRALPLAFETGAGVLAVDLFLEISASANKLVLEGPTWLRLGKGLGARQKWAAAHWCLRAAAATGADESATDKARLSLGETALSQGAVAEALQIYETFVADRPSSSFVDFAREGAAMARKRIPQGVS